MTRQSTHSHTLSWVCISFYFLHMISKCWRYCFYNSQLHMYTQHFQDKNNMPWSSFYVKQLIIKRNASNRPFKMAVWIWMIILLTKTFMKKQWPRKFVSVLEYITLLGWTGTDLHHCIQVYAFSLLSSFLSDTILLKGWGWNYSYVIIFTFNKRQNTYITF